MCITLNMDNMSPQNQYRAMVIITAFQIYILKNIVFFKSLKTGADFRLRVLQIQLWPTSIFFSFRWYKNEKLRLPCWRKHSIITLWKSWEYVSQNGRALFYKGGSLHLLQRPGGEYALKDFQGMHWLLSLSLCGHIFQALCIYMDM